MSTILADKSWLHAVIKIILADKSWLHNLMSMILDYKSQITCLDEYDIDW